MIVENRNTHSIYAYHGLFRNEFGGSMHLAIQNEDGTFTSLNSTCGILFPKAELSEGKLSGTTKILQNPWAFRMCDGTFGVAALRQSLLPNENGTEPYESALEKGKENCILFFQSKDLVSYTETGLAEVAPKGTKIQDVSCEWCGEKYLLTLATDKGVFTCESKDLTHFGSLQPSKNAPQRVHVNLWDAATACRVEVTEEEYQKLLNCLMPLQNVGVSPVEVTVPAGEKAVLPKAVLHYNDGSTFEMPVKWDEFDTQKPGDYVVTGHLQQRKWGFPITGERGDPMAIRYHGKYYYMATDDEHGQLALKIRVVDSIDEIAKAEDHVIFAAAKSGEFSGCLWAPELHLIQDHLFIFFAAGSPDWFTVQSHVMELTGSNPANAADWSKPIRCKTKNKEVLCKNGITLDMTVVQDAGAVYTIWAQRQIKKTENSMECGNSDLYIAKVDPQKPWQQISEAVLLKHPVYGWERAHSDVNEGPFALRHGSDIFVTYAAALIDYTYCVGVIRAKAGTDLLNPNSWGNQNYPLLHSLSMPDQIGGGHNSFVKDEYGNDILMIHAIPVKHYRSDSTDMRRYPTFRTVHWDAQGTPRLDMTLERELNPCFAEIKASVHVK